MNMKLILLTLILAAGMYVESMQAGVTADAIDFATSLAHSETGHYLLIIQNHDNGTARAVTLYLIGVAQSRGYCDADITQFVKTGVNEFERKRHA